MLTIFSIAKYDSYFQDNKLDASCMRWYLYWVAAQVDCLRDLQSPDLKDYAFEVSLAAGSDFVKLILRTSYHTCLCGTQGLEREGPGYYTLSSLLDQLRAEGLLPNPEELSPAYDAGARVKPTGLSRIPAEEREAWIIKQAEEAQACLVSAVLGLLSMIGFDLSLEPGPLSWEYVYGRSMRGVTSDINTPRMFDYPTFEQWPLNFGPLQIFGPSKIDHLSEFRGIGNNDYSFVEGSASSKFVDPAQHNAYWLHQLAGVQIEWTPEPRNHLRYNLNTRVLTLFRFPSFFLVEMWNSAKNRFWTRGTTSTFTRSGLGCWIGEEMFLKTYGGRWEELPEDSLQSLIERLDNNSSSTLVPPITTEILAQEILLSYRVLFGSNSRARANYKFLKPKYEDYPPDPVLDALCSQRNGKVRQWSHSDRNLTWEKETYILGEDFQVFAQRWVVLMNVLQQTRAKGWRKLLKDKRDIVQYWTFWLVIMVGTISILLSLGQLIVGALQLARTPIPV